MLTSGDQAQGEESNERMNASQIRKTLCLAAAAAVLAGCAGAPTTPEPQPVAPANHRHVMHSEPDEFGRQLYGMRHEASPETLEELRGSVAFRDMSDERIMRLMSMMPSNYTWSVSGLGVSGSGGALVLGHGFGDHGDRVLHDQLMPLGAERPLGMSFGMSMAMSDHIQLGLDNLTAAGARDIVVVPLVSTRHNTLKRQWDYIFGLSDEPGYAKAPRVDTEARLHFAPPLEDHPLVGRMVVDHVLEISENPQAEEVVIVGHGPVDDADNRAQLVIMERLADYVRAAGDFAAVHVASLQDDAPPEVRSQNVRALRAIVEGAAERGNKALVVTNLIGTRMVQSQLHRDLRGLGYKYNFKGLVQHPRFIDWISLAVEDNLPD